MRFDAQQVNETLIVEAHGVSHTGSISSVSFGNPPKGAARRIIHHGKARSGTSWPTARRTASRICVPVGALLLLDFEEVLKEAGFVVLAVTSGKKAVEYLKAAESSIAGIVTDIRFAESPSGWDVARIAREIDPEMPVVYISGDSAPDWVSQGVPKSIMIEKPFVISQLIVAISQLLNDRTAGAAALE